MSVAVFPLCEGCSYIESNLKRQRKVREEEKKRRRMESIKKRKSKVPPRKKSSLSHNNYGACASPLVIENSQSEQVAAFTVRVPFPLQWLQGQGEMGNGQMKRRSSSAVEWPKAPSAVNVFESLHAIATMGLGLGEEEDVEPRWTGERIDGICRLETGQ